LFNYSYNVQILFIELILLINYYNIIGNHPSQPINYENSIHNIDNNISPRTKITKPELFYVMDKLCQNVFMSVFIL
jgi:hypothetical protein